MGIIQRAGHWLGIVGSWMIPMRRAGQNWASWIPALPRTSGREMPPGPSGKI